MTPRKYMDDYNYHDWSRFMVREPKQRPTGPHFAAVLFETRTEYTPSYDQDDPGSSCSVPDIHYFAFPDRETLQKWVLRAAKDKKQFFCFEVKRLASVELKVNVELEV